MADDLEVGKSVETISPDEPPTDLDARYVQISDFQQWAKDLVVDQALWDSVTSELASQRDGADGKALDRAVEVAMRAAALDTGALEGLYETDRGFTYSIALEEAATSTTLRARDERLPDFFAAQLRGYELAAAIAVDQHPVTEMWIRQLHEVLSAPQATYSAWTSQGWRDLELPKGEYKRYPNHVRNGAGEYHAYAPVASTPSEMHRLVENLEAPEFKSAHPAIQSAYAHYSFVCIHPFADGNGRVARALASIYSRRGTGVSLLIWADERADYFEALEASDNGNRQAFVDFIFDKMIDTARLVRDQLGPHPATVAAGFGRLHRSHGGMTFTELDTVAGEVIGLVHLVTNEIIAEAALPPGVSGHAQRGGTRWPATVSPYREPVQVNNIVHVELRSTAPAQGIVVRTMRVLVAKTTEQRYGFQLQCQQSPSTLELRLKDVHPTVADSVSFQIKMWVQRIVGEGLTELDYVAEQALRAAGY
jgi:Fic family protein